MNYAAVDVGSSLRSSVDSQSGEDAADAMVVDETVVNATAVVDAQARQRLDSSLLETLAAKFLSTRYFALSVARRAIEQRLA